MDTLTSQQLAGAYFGMAHPFRVPPASLACGCYCQNLLTPTAPVQFIEVKAHAGNGNQAQDTPASQVHSDQHVATSIFCDPSVGGPAWVHFGFGATLSDLDTLKHHSLTIATDASYTALVNQPDRQRYHTLLAIKAI